MQVWTCGWKGGGRSCTSPAKRGAERESQDGCRASSPVKRQKLKLQLYAYYTSYPSHPKAKPRARLHFAIVTWVHSTVDLRSLHMLYALCFSCSRLMELFMLQIYPWCKNINSLKFIYHNLGCYAGRKNINFCYELHTSSAIRSRKYPAQFTEGQRVYSASLFKSVTDLSGPRAWDSAGELKRTRWDILCSCLVQ